MIGTNALRSTLNRIKKKISPFGKRKISVVHYDAFTGKVDLPEDEEKLNEQGVLLTPEPIQNFDLWEKFCSIPSKDVKQPILDEE